jgi:hypothetical protein
MRDRLLSSLGEKPFGEYPYLNDIDLESPAKARKALKDVPSA